MSLKPLISIALCTYNGEKYLREQMDSLINQTYSNLEIIVVDDCSSDGTIPLLKEYCRDQRVKLYQNEKNLGFSKNFEKSISLCTGDMIALCDQDDIWDLKKIEILQREIKESHLIYCDSEFIDQGGHSLKRKLSDVRNFYEGEESEVFLLNNCVSGHALLFKRELLQFLYPFPEKVFHDWWIAFVASSTGKITYYHECLVKYRQHGNASTDILNMREEPEEERISRKEKREKQLAHILGWINIFRQYRHNKPRHQKLFEDLYNAYLLKKESYFCQPLFSILMKKRKTLFYIRKKPLSSKLFYIYKESIGFKFKELIYRK
jgi:glycosyltransferase involved in cell wall biosynthesis